MKFLDGDYFRGNVDDENYLSISETLKTDILKQEFDEVLKTHIAQWEQYYIGLSDALWYGKYFAFEDVICEKICAGAIKNYKMRE